MATVKFHSLMALVTKKDSREIKSQKIREMVAILIEEFPALEIYFFSEDIITTIPAIAGG